jgi:hypothetical protein
VPEAQFEGEHPKFVWGVKSVREVIPVKGFKHLIAPLELHMYVDFEEAKSKSSMLVLDGGEQFSGTKGDAANGELDLCWWGEVECGCTW